MAYNTTNLTGIDSLSGLAGFASSATDGLFFGIILISLFIILIVNQKNYGIASASASAGFACFMISIFLLYLKAISILFPIFFVLIIAGSLMYLKFNPD